LGGRAEDVAGWDYFDLKKEAAAANAPAVFIAPQGIDGRWGEIDHALLDDITTFAKDNLCIDTTRVFVTGMSFGGMITYSLSTNHQKRFRAGVAPRSRQLRYLAPRPQTEGSDRLDAHDRHGRQYLPLGRRRQSRIEIHRSRESRRQWLHAAGHDPDVAIGQTHLLRLRGMQTGLPRQGLHL
jgi:hypothetical protein